MTKYYYPKRRATGSFVAITKFPSGKRKYNVVGFRCGNLVKSTMTARKDRAIKLKNRLIKKMDKSFGCR